MYKKKARFHLPMKVLGTSMAAALLLSGCAGSAGSDTTESAGEDTLSIAFVPKNLGNPYFDASGEGAQEAITEFGGKYQEVAPTTNTPSGQVSFINTLTQQLVDGIAISAADPTAPCDALQQAMEAGIAVVTYDSDTNTECRDLAVIQASAEGIAKAQVDLIAEQIGGSGEVAIISGSANAPTQNQWIDLMMAELKANHPDITVVETVYSDNDDQLAFDKTAGLLQSYPKLSGIIAPDTVAIAAAGRYLQTSERKGEVMLTGLGLPNQMREYVKDGTVTAFALWNPADLGYLAAFALRALSSGDITGSEGDTFEAGKLGSYTVEADGLVLLGAPTVFNSDNIDQFDF